MTEESEGKYHVHGELTFVPKELQYSMFTDIKSIIELASSHQKIIISPLPRYLNARCCGDADHMSNLEEEGYRRNLVEEVLACRKNLRDFAFRLGIRNLRVACPWSQLRNSTVNIWADPVYLNAEGFSLLATLTLKTIKQNNGVDLDGGGGGSGGGGNPSNKRSHRRLSEDGGRRAPASLERGSGSGGDSGRPRSVGAEVAATTGDLRVDAVGTGVESGGEAGSRCRSGSLQRYCPIEYLLYKKL